MNFLDPRLPDRFWDKVTPEPNSGCWLWTAQVNKCGYGVFRAESTESTLAHRTSYRAFVGAVPFELELDHRVCSTRCCVNPAHLEAVTHAENMRRSPHSGRYQREKTHCPQGHPYAGTNCFAPSVNGGRGGRRCRVCGNERARRRRAQSHVIAQQRQGA